MIVIPFHFTHLCLTSLSLLQLAIGDIRQNAPVAKMIEAWLSKNNMNKGPITKPQFIKFADQFFNEDINAALFFEMFDLVQIDLFGKTQNNITHIYTPRTTDNITT